MTIEFSVDASAAEVPAPINAGVWRAGDEDVASSKIHARILREEQDGPATEALAPIHGWGVAREAAEINRLEKNSDSGGGDDTDRRAESSFRHVLFLVDI